MPSAPSPGNAAARSTLASRCETLTQSEIRAMSIECERLGGVNLSQGVCDMPLPRPLIDAAAAAIADGPNSYTRYDGIAELREAIAKKLLSFNGVEADPEGEIVVSAGATGAFYCACLALLDPGDEVILFEPYYGYHVTTLRAVGAVPRFVRMSPGDWSFDPEALAAACSTRTKAIMINTPANPSGKIWSRAELEGLAEFARSRDLVVFTDEIYEYIAYDSVEHVSPASLPGLKDRTVTISGYSKTFSITGWRIGYAACRPDWAKMIGYMNDLVYVCAPAPLQKGVAVALGALDESYYRELGLELTAKRGVLCAALERAGLRPHVPQGAYYVLADVSRLPGRTGKERAMHLLETTGVASVPGEAFYHKPEDGYGLARFCFAKTDKELEEACRRLGELR
ncbi:MAG: aminotransferase [Elusimicrobia bacterium CG_4_9_14_3_um_filter_62_55]|nr:MAG: aminotransferase [Elusimicrobia bacterium CG22_combo_CG10-13_8_21_14_all_63_91]PJB24381.1 MAG: aminotransferase [Elusimicrobia bacterium CG_4_9_14_3_um_filter_62_55]